MRCDPSFLQGLWANATDYKEVVRSLLESVSKGMPWKNQQYSMSFHKNKTTQEWMKCHLSVYIAAYLVGFFFNCADLLEDR